MIEENSGKNVIEKYKKTAEEKNKEINAVLSFCNITGNTEGKYYGIPFFVKDNIVIDGTVTTCASKILENYKAPYTATAVKKLLEKGFTVIGKTNMDEFAMGGTNENSAFGPVRNPVNMNKIPGGSSGGSAAAVAAGMAPFALGSDTGGSVREPASFCGVVGFKPTYGTISRYGLIAFGSSLDQIGVISEEVCDAALITDIMSGKDEKDSTTLNREFSIYEDYQNETKENKLYSIAVPDIVFSEGIDEEIKKRMKNIISKLKNKDYNVDIVSIPELKYSVSVYYVIAPSEASSNLSRFDGVRYGLRDSKEGLVETYRNTRGKGFGLEVKRRVLMGTFTLSSAYYDAYFSKASKVRNIISEKMNKCLEKYDAILTPTAPVLPPDIGEKLSPLSYYLMDLFTIPANLSGLPAVSVPAGKINGLPFGIHFTGKKYEDGKLLALSETI